MKVFGIFTEDGLDQCVETQELATSEAKDLRAMGCSVKVCHGEESELYVMDDLMRDGMSYGRAYRSVMVSA
jgi:hypothetical protein